MAKKFEKHYSSNVRNNIVDVLANRSERDKWIFRVDANGKRYVKGNEQLTQEQFNTRFPIAIKPFRKHGLNPDRRNLWMQDDKSY